MSPSIIEFLWSGEKLELRHFTLLVLLLVVLLLDPLFKRDLSAIFLAILVISAWLVSSDQPRIRRVLLVLAIPIAALIIRDLYLQPIWAPDTKIQISPVLAILIMVFLVYCGIIILRSLLCATDVNLNQIIGTINIFLIIGYLWAYMYLLLEVFREGTFSNISPEQSTISELIYFSFVTLTTLGYGDITPQQPFAARLAILEAIIGQFYIAVVVTYLLTIFISSRLDKKPS